MNTIRNKTTQFSDLGRIAFKEAWTLQTALFEKILAIKSVNRDLPADLQHVTENYLLFCEHDHVYTLGKSGKESNMLVEAEGLPSLKATYYHINRGGDITYHGPGQMVGYPILDLENFFTDIHKYMRALEEVIIQTVAEYGIVAGRIAGLTGVWVDSENPHEARKLCAFGVRASRWVTMHGFALNVNTDLEYFNHIIPCGIRNKTVTSLQKELGYPVAMQEVRELLKDRMSTVFGMEVTPVIEPAK